MPAEKFTTDTTESLMQEFEYLIFKTIFTISALSTEPNTTKSVSFLDTLVQFILNFSDKFYIEYYFQNQSIINIIYDRLVKKSTFSKKNNNI